MKTFLIATILVALVAFSSTQMAMRTKKTDMRSRLQRMKDLFRKEFYDESQSSNGNKPER